MLFRISVRLQAQVQVLPGPPEPATHCWDTTGRLKKRVDHVKLSQLELWACAARAEKTRSIGRESGRNRSFSVVTRMD